MEFWGHDLIVPKIIAELLDDEVPITNILGALYELASEGKIKGDPYQIFLEGSLYRYTIVNIPEEKKDSRDGVELTKIEFDQIILGWLDQPSEEFKIMSGSIIRKWLNIWTGD